MKIWFGLLGLGLGLAGAACSGFDVGDSTGCQAACERAAICGFLPSALGWSEAAELGPSVEDCARRCSNSPRSDATVTALLACLDGSQESTEWCEDEADSEYARWVSCAGIARCLDKIDERKVLAGQAALTVSLVGFANFESDFGADTDTGGLADTDGGEEVLTVEGLYTKAPEMAAAVTSCRAALCSDALCGESELARPCDDTLCRNPASAATQVCTSLGIERIVVTARQPGAMQVRATMYDAEDEDAMLCSRSTTAELTAADYALVPGPVALGLQVTGTLKAAELLRIDYTGASEAFAADPEASIRYCINFAGPSVILRAGTNPAVIPIGSISELVERGLDAARLGECPV